jgi:hypothetical protein
MCHRSVGLVQGEIERAGIPTVSLSVRPEVTYGMNVPRAAYLRFPHGNPLGEPDRPEQHHVILEALLRLLETATGAPTLVELPVRWKRWEPWL